MRCVKRCGVVPGPPVTRTPSSGAIEGGCAVQLHGVEHLDDSVRGMAAADVAAALRAFDAQIPKIDISFS